MSTDSAAAVALNPETDLDLPLEKLVGKASATSLAKHVDVHTVGQLLDFFPRRYLDRGELSPIHELPVDSEVTLIAQVVSVNTRSMRARKGSITDVVVTDAAQGTLGGTLKISFFNGWRAQRDLRPGSRAMFSGKVGAYQGALNLTNPDYTLLDSQGSVDERALAAAPIPIYPATAKLPSWKTANVVSAVLDVLNLSTLPDPLPAEVLQSRNLMPLAQAYEAIHRPSEVADFQRARARFRYQEAFVLQSALARRRHDSAQLVAIPRPVQAAGLLHDFDAELPFTLTRGQQEVGEQISADLAGSSPMQRLLQGEVGSGKTLVALRAMLQVVDAGGQAALLAPTEVLAAQHYQSLTKTLGPLAQAGMLGGAEKATRVTLLTGSMKTTGTKQALLQAASGEAGIVIGTHALLADRVQFADLGLVVVDEQHRFGVEQRDALRAKASAVPHVLVMTATPIPRTVAMTVFGDLETSVLRELPAGRAPISTHAVGLVENPGWEQRIWQRSREEIDAGHQVYVVCPRIGEAEGAEDSKAGGWGGDELLGPDSAGLDSMGPNSAGPGEGGTGERELKSVLTVLAQLQAEPALAGCRIEALHGKMDPEQKAAVMADFAAGSVDVLVSTTVIEVGVDVHNATLMVILDADRFGISQLHQLRGRVGRGGLPGTALLVTELEPENPSRARLEAVASTVDGFELAQKDVELRREGDILGASQSGGRSTLRLLRVIRDEVIIEQARGDAQRLIEADPQLAEHPALAALMERVLDEEREAFLERG